MIAGILTLVEVRFFSFFLLLPALPVSFKFLFFENIFYSFLFHITSFPKLLVILSCLFIFKGKPWKSSGLLNQLSLSKFQNFIVSGLPFPSYTLSTCKFIPKNLIYCCFNGDVEENVCLNGCGLPEVSLDCWCQYHVNVKRWWHHFVLFVLVMGVIFLYSKQGRKRERESVFERGSQHVSFGPKCSSSFENSYLIIVFLLMATFFFIY